MALYREGQLLGIKEAASNQFIHGEKLHVFIDELLSELQRDVDDLTGIMVSKGPGSYTGLRIGVSAAKGLAYALSLPLYSAPTLGCFPLDELAQDKAISVLDARRDEVYYQIWTRESDRWSAAGPASFERVNPESWMSLLRENEVAIIGDCTDKVADLLGTDRPNVHIQESSFPSAAHMGRFIQGAVSEDVAYFEPHYLKDFVQII